MQIRTPSGESGTLAVLCCGSAYTACPTSDGQNCPVIKVVFSLPGIAELPPGLTKMMAQ